jgi:hypothetical protein
MAGLATMLGRHAGQEQIPVALLMSDPGYVSWPKKIGSDHSNWRDV